MFKWKKLGIGAVCAVIIYGLINLSFALAQTNTAASDPILKKNAAKLIAEFLELPPGKKIKCFSDLKTKDPATPFICALKKANIAKSAKNKFYPNSKTSWGFAIRSLCRGKKWVNKKTFAACGDYAKSKGFLAAPLPASPSSKTKITQSELSLFLERIAAYKEKTVLPPLTEIPPRETVTLGAVPFTEQTINRTFFANIFLAKAFSNHFYHNEVYFIEGEIIDSPQSVEEVFVFLCPQNRGCDDSENFIGPVENGRFKIPVTFKVGNYQMGLIPGRSGQSRVTDITVLPEAPQPTSGGTQATNLSTTYDKGETKFNWDGEGSLTRLIIFQDEKRKEYIFRQGTKSFAPNPTDFSGFKNGRTGWVVEQNNLTSPIKEMDLITQEFRKIETDDVEVKNMQEVFEGPAHFIFRGKAKNEISKRAAITLPNGQVQEIVFEAEDVAADAEFTVETDLLTNGTYIFEVNNPEGGATVNVPLYVGTGTPLLPDFFALNQQEPETTPIGDLTAAREKLLKLINKDRAANSAPPVQLSNSLNIIAQNHSKNMIEHDFFGHTDNAGKGPDERRKQALYTAPIKENLGKASTLELVEAGLMRSPVHRATLIDKDLTKIGLGIMKNAEGYFIVTQNFSTDPLSQSDLPALEETLFAAAQKKRGDTGLSLLSHDNLLRPISQEWSLRMARDNFFAVTDTRGEKLLDLARNRGINSAIQAHIVQVSEKKLLSEEFMKQEALINGNNKNIGIGLGINTTGELFMTVLYTP